MIEIETVHLVAYALRVVVAMQGAVMHCQGSENREVGNKRTRNENIPRVQVHRDSNIERT